MYIPAKSKFRKFQKGALTNKINNVLLFNQSRYGKLKLISLTSGKISSSQIFTMKKTISKIIKKKGKMRINIFPNIGISKKPKEVRMGKGKGSLDFWAFKVIKGTILVEIEISQGRIGLKALKRAQYKLPFNTKILKN